MAEIGLSIGKALERMARTMHALADVGKERTAQDKKWGEQNHPDLSPNTAGYSVSDACGYYGLPHPDYAKALCDSEHKHGGGSWISIHVEELTEAVEQFALGNVEAAREELVQLAATVTAHVEHIDRRAESSDPRADAQGGGVTEDDERGSGQ